MRFVKKLLTPNPYSRPQRTEDMQEIKAVVLHWIAAPKQNPEHVYNWFEKRKYGKHSYGSAHYCVGLDGEIWQYIPDEEMAYHVGSKTYTEHAMRLSSYPNNCTLGVEMSHINWEGEYSYETWEETKKLTALILMEHGLTEKDITTHKAIVGWKECPQWFHRFPEEFDRFVDETKELMDNGFKGFTTARFGLNVRDDVMGNKVAKLSNGESFDILGIKNLWYKIKMTDGTIGYASSKYIQLIQVVEASI